MSPDPNPARKTLSDDAEALPAPLGGTRDEAMQRLQIGLLGLAAMILMVMLANIVMERANQTDAATVPEAVDASASGQDAAGVKDPLADAGVVPDLPASDPGAQKDAARMGAKPARDVP
jgi:hypothetical protein